MGEGGGGGIERTLELSGPRCLHAVGASRLSFVMQGGWEGQNKAMRNSQQRTTQSRKLWSSTVLNISFSAFFGRLFDSHLAPVRTNWCPAPWPARYRLRPHRRFTSSFGQLALVGTLDVWPLRGTAVSCTPYQTATIRGLHWRCVFAPATTRVITKQGRTTSPFCLNVTFDNGRARAPPRGPFPLAFPAHCPHGGRAKRWPLTMSSFQLERDLSIR